MLSYFLSFLEFDINGSVEACMGLLNDIYEDGVKWHDIACYHTKVKAKTIALKMNNIYTKKDVNKCID